MKLRHIKSSDINDISEYVMSHEVTKYLTWETYTSRDEVKSFVVNASSKIGFPDEFLAIEHNDKVIGTAHLIYRKDGCTQVGFGLIPSVWNKGRGKKIFSTILDMCRSGDDRSSHTKTIRADIHKQNAHGIKIIVDAGGVQTNDLGERTRFEFYLA